MKKPLPAFMQKMMADKAGAKDAPKKSNPFGGMKGGGCTKMAKGGAVKYKNANQLGGDLSGSKHFGRSTGEGIEKSYKASTKALKSKGADGIAQRGRTKPQASKEM